MKSFLADVNIYEEEQTDGRILRSLKFRFPVFFNGKEIYELDWDNESTVEACCLSTKTSAAQSEFTAAAVPASAKHESGTTSDFLERVSNRKADSYVKLNVKMEDYYRIKDAEGSEMNG